jgi:hypothetical protein
MKLIQVKKQAHIIQLDTDNSEVTIPGLLEETIIKVLGVQVYYREYISSVPEDIGDGNHVKNKSVGFQNLGGDAVNAGYPEDTQCINQKM